MSHPFRLYGHRGAAAHHPENTRRAFVAAVEAGVHALETDVRLTSDGQVVVFHDADGVRTANRPERLRAVPWSEVGGWDIGEGEHPMLLADVLEEWPDLFVNVDVKDDSEEAALATLEVVRRSGREDQVGLATFHRNVSGVLLDAGWTGQMGLVPREVAAAKLLPAVVSRRVIRGTAAQIPTHQGRIRLDGERFVARCHGLGLRVDYWTIDDPAEAIRLVRRGADGIVTNDPAAVGAALRVEGLTS